MKGVILEWGLICIDIVGVFIYIIIWDNYVGLEFYIIDCVLCELF